MPRKRDPANEEERRQQLTDACFDLLAKAPVGEVTLAGVARAAGVSKGMLTYYWQSKDALILETLRRYHARTAERLAGIAAEPRPARERLRALVEAAFPSRAAVEREVRFQLEVVSYAKGRRTLTRVVRQGYRSFRDGCALLVAIGAAEGYVTVKDPERLYVMIHALIDGLSMQIALDPSLDVAEQREQLVRSIEVLLRCDGQAAPARHQRSVGG